ncbi:arylesterase [Pseudoteredinibacter isoporae]|uniref:Acyl-CoA thioesterase-1 n=1 Tax=Pseudoteredinibacter isoporae TaxID=570281 RepID=A0A7X0JXX9_9GAMM|nr:arylesterase [Pseudoteredinibacter isoporae]MBB6523570.1 acyl-CoA thioesterase-1 [Pseudoteredinibacter isoporae]
MKLAHNVYLILVLLFSSVAVNAESDPSGKRTLMVLGDSISAAYGMKPEEGWVALLDKRLATQNISTVNASISGETTAGGLARLEALLAKYQPDWVIVELGGNDGLRGYPVNRMKANLAGIIEQSQSASADVLLIGMQIPPNYGKRYTRMFSEAYPALAEQYGITLVPTFLESVAVKPDAMQEDGIHPNASAQDQLLAVAWPEIQRMIQE